MLFDPPMVLFQAVVEVLVAAVLDRLPQHLTNRPRIRGMPIRRHAFGCLPSDDAGLTEEVLRSVHIPRCAQHRVDQVALLPG